MDDNFSPRVKDVIAFSKEEALRLGHDFIGTEHLMLGLLRDGNGKAIEILGNLEVDLTHLRRKVEILSPSNPNSTVNATEKKNLHLTRQAERALKTTFIEAKLFQNSSINTAHLLLCILRNENDPTTKLLLKLNVDYDRVKEQFKFLISEDEEDEINETKILPFLKMTMKINLQMSPIHPPSSPNLELRNQKLLFWIILAEILLLWQKKINSILSWVERVRFCAFLKFSAAERKTTPS